MTAAAFSNDGGIVGGLDVASALKAFRDAEHHQANVRVEALGVLQLPELVRERAKDRARVERLRLQQSAAKREAESLAAYVENLEKLIVVHRSLRVVKAGSVGASE